MRNPVIRKFLIWLPPAVFAGVIAICQTFPTMRELVERVAAIWWVSVMDDRHALLAVAMMVAPIAIYILALAWVSSPKPPRRWKRSSLDRLRRALTEPDDRK